MASEKLKSSYYGLVEGENWTRHILLLLMRLYWGGLLVLAGLGKWMNIDGVAAFFAELGIPLPTFSTYLVGAIEFLGGISLLVGFLTRFFTLPLVVVFFVAYATAHADAMIMFFTNPKVFTSQEPFLYLLTSLIVMAFGPGALSIDALWEKRVYGKSL